MSSNNLFIYNFKHYFIQWMVLLEVLFIYLFQIKCNLVVLFFLFEK